MSKITIGKKVFNIKENVINQNDLLFYEENPRIYSILQSSDVITQQEIESILSKMKHVEQLLISIEQNGGIIEPLITIKKNNKYIVLEGNSRLAAYRILAAKDPLKWKEIRCCVLPNTVSDDEIFTLLGQYHLVGRRDWNAFEQAAYLFRKKKSSNLGIRALAKNAGLTIGKVEKLLRTYNFMCDNNDLKPDRWSYYYEYLNSQDIKNYRMSNPEIDTAIVSQIKSGKIKRALDIRNVFKPIAKGNNEIAKQLMNKIIKNKINIYDAYDHFESTGKTGEAYIKIKRFCETVKDNNFQKKIKSEKNSIKDVVCEFKKIKFEIDKLLEEIHINKDEKVSVPTLIDMFKK